MQCIRTSSIPAKEQQFVTVHISVFSSLFTGFEELWTYLPAAQCSPVASHFQLSGMWLLGTRVELRALEALEIALQPADKWGGRTGTAGAMGGGILQVSRFVHLSVISHLTTCFCDWNSALSAFWRYPEEQH